MRIEQAVIEGLRRSRWNRPHMPKVTPKQMAAAIRKHMDHSTNEALYARCDELEVLQKAMFLDLASFAKDGATDGQITELIGFAFGHAVSGGGFFRRCGKTD